MNPWPPLDSRTGRYSPWRTDAVLVSGWPWGWVRVGYHADERHEPCVDCAARAGQLVPEITRGVQDSDLLFADGTRRCAAHAHDYCRRTYTACALIAP